MLANHFMNPGLTNIEAEKRLKEQGLNRLKKPYEVKFLGIVKEEITEPMILLLLFVGVVYSFWGKLEDALTIFAVIAVLVFVEVWNEYRAKKAISALSEIASPVSKVYRDNKIVNVKSEEIVPGDLIILSAGTRIPADAKIISSFSLSVDESSLTGESNPAEKKENDLVYAGTLVTGGEGRAIVASTGFSTRIGKISLMAEAIKPPKSPLQLSMKSLAKKLVWAALLFSITIPLLGLLRGGDVKEMILTGLALAFAVIPEELPIIITMILGLGAYDLSSKNFLVKKVKAAEVLGDATVILTDKTGTITENKMKIVSVYPEKDEELIVRTAHSALTESSLSPTDDAVRKKFEESGLKNEDNNILRERVFGNGRKTKTIMFNDKIVSVGAPEEILKMCASHGNNVKKILYEEAGKGRRVIGVAVKKIKPSMRDNDFKVLEKGMKFLGLLSLEDSPRKGVKETIELARKAGVRTIMVTGDHPDTAKFIAGKVGINTAKVLTGEDLDKLSDNELRQIVKDVSVFARTSPEHKYSLVKALHANGEVVAVTGDGVNDSLALKGADIGIAMGIKGTDAAKEAADVVLADDNYVTISNALFEGRKFYSNLKKGVKYYLSVKTALILVFLLPVILNIPLPFAPIQIIILELFMDLAASAGFVAEPAEKKIYTEKPVKKGSFIDKKMITNVLFSGILLFLAVMISYIYALFTEFPELEARSFAFNAWIMGHIILAFLSRSDNESLFTLGFFTNKVMNLWALAVVGFLALINLSGTVSAQLKLEMLSGAQLIFILIVCIIVLSVKEILKLFRKNK
ncbi:ATPase [archaeon CG07_land_8_20_14_0_80_38_8]|nr:MAG: ATPase [archaeon CG07_land_8_20_14_0_80_38_8]